MSVIEYLEYDRGRILVLEAESYLMFRNSRKEVSGEQRRREHRSSGRRRWGREESVRQAL